MVRGHAYRWGSEKYFWWEESPKGAHKAEKVIPARVF